MSDIKKDYTSMDYKDIDDMFYYKEGAHAMTASERFREVKYCLGELLSPIEDVATNLKVITHETFSKIKPKNLSEKLINKEIGSAEKAVSMLLEIKSKLIGFENIFKKVKPKIKPASFYDFNYIVDNIINFSKFSEIFVKSSIGNNLNIFQASNGRVDIISLLLDVQKNNVDIVKKAKEISEIPGLSNFEWKDDSQLNEHLCQLKSQIDDMHMKYQLVKESMLSILDMYKK